jgi:putative NADH-flavin reductase
MARISVLGGTGFAGSAVVGEAVARGHQVTSVSRHEATNKIDGVRYIIGSVLEPEVLEASVTGQDVVIEAVSPRGDMAGEEEGLVDRLIELTAGTGTRLGVIGGASSLLVEEGGSRLYDVSEMPPEVRPEIETGMAMLEALKAAPLDVDWFYVSPPASFGAWAART